MIWNAFAEDALGSLAAAQRRRSLAVVEPCISFATNDYLGLAMHSAVRRAAIDATERFGAGAQASRLVAGSRAIHEELEAALATWKSTDRALVFSSGYLANVGVIAALGEGDVTIFSDALNHASIIDGCRLARARTIVYRHLDLNDLELKLAQARGRIIVVSESVFSMDGDDVDELALAELCAQYGALLILDEAHAVFHARMPDGEILRVGTLSKMLGSLGGFVCGSHALIELIANRARTFIFTTALAPANAAAALAALRICQSNEGAGLRAALSANIEQFGAHRSPIVPIHCGANAHALAIAHLLLQRGLHVPAIRPPTVPEGTARLRISLSATHTPAMIARLRAALDEVFA